MILYDDRYFLITRFKQGSYMIWKSWKIGSFDSNSRKSCNDKNKLIS